MTIQTQVPIRTPSTATARSRSPSCGIVPIDVLPTNKQPIIDGYNAYPASPLNLTPTECGLNGMASACAAFKNSTGIDCVGLLITDGTPTECQTDDTQLGNILSPAFKTLPGEASDARRSLRTSQDAPMESRDLTAGTTGDGRDVLVEDWSGRRFRPLYKLLHGERRARRMLEPDDQFLPNEPFETVWVYELPKRAKELRLLLPFENCVLPFRLPQ